MRGNYDVACRIPRLVSSPARISEPSSFTRAKSHSRFESDSGNRRAFWPMLAVRELVYLVEKAVFKFCHLTGLPTAEQSTNEVIRDESSEKCSLSHCGRGIDRFPGRLRLSSAANDYYN